MNSEAPRGGINRRDFLERAGTAAGAGLATSGMLAGLAPTVASAQEVRKRPQRVAVVGVDHYHATSTPNYPHILQGQRLDIRGVHAPDAAIAAKWAAEYGSTPYTDYRAMIDKAKPEFVVALGHYAAMPADSGFSWNRASRS